MLCPQISFYNDKVFGPFLEEHFQMKLQQIRPAVMYVSKFLALNLELDPPDYSNLGENPEDVSFAQCFNIFAGQNRGVPRLPDSELPAAELPGLDCAPRRAVTLAGNAAAEEHSEEPRSELSPQERARTGRSTAEDQTNQVPLVDGWPPSEADKDKAHSSLRDATRKTHLRSSDLSNINSSQGINDCTVEINLQTYIFRTYTQKQIKTTINV